MSSLPGRGNLTAKCSTSLFRLSIDFLNDSFLSNSFRQSTSLGPLIFWTSMASWKARCRKSAIVLMSELRTPLERMQLVFAKFPIHKNLLSKFKNAKKSNNTKIEYPFSAHRSSHYLQMPPYPKFSKKSAPTPLDFHLL